MEFVDFIKKKTEDKYDFVKLTEVAFDGEETCTCKFVYDGKVRDLTDSDKSLFSDLLREYIGVECNIVVKFKKEAFDHEVLFQYVSTFIQKMFPSAYSTFKPKNLEIQNVDEDGVLLKISVLDTYFQYMKSRDFEHELKNYLAHYYFKSFAVELVEIATKNKIQEALIEQESIVQSIVDATNYDAKVETFKIDESRKLIGEELTGECRFYKNLRRPIKDILTAGKIANIYEHSFKSKTQKDEDGNAKEKVMYRLKFDLRGETLDGVYFPKDQDLANFQTLNVGDEIIFTGDIEEFNGKTNCKIKQMSLCKLPEFEEEKIEFRKVNKEYKFAKPEEYIVNEQSDLFSFGIEKQVNDILKNNTFVVYDFETTGLNFMENEIIEIGAVKIIDGKIKETFDVFVKPQKVERLPIEIVNLTHITDEMVKDAHTINEVIQDFYKFCYGSIMVGHNSIGFDNLFLQKNAKENKYNFDNKQLDTYKISMQYLKGLKNYKLKTIAEHLEVKLENAHRAIYDVLATAEVFIKLTDMMESI